MNTKVELAGLSVSSYAHPREKELGLSQDNSALVADALDRFSDFSLSVCKQIIMGKYVEVKQADMPELHSILRDVCRILDYDGERIRLYITRDYQPSTMQVGGEERYVLLPDLVVERADRDVLHYLLGNAVGMFKGGHIRLATINSVLMYLPVATVNYLLYHNGCFPAELKAEQE